MKMTKLEAQVCWDNSLERGMERCRQEQKPLFLDFFKEG